MKKDEQIYLDYAATTPLDPRVAECMYDVMKNEYGNPASRSHAYGWRAERLVDEARKDVAKLINADFREIVFTSGATESDNLAIKGVAKFYQGKGKHIITCKTEHKAVLDTVRQLEREGYEITYLTPKEDGRIDLEDIKNVMRDDTILVSIMHVNNEVGVVQDVKEIGKLTRERGIIFHVDAAQSVGKITVDVREQNIDLLSISAHKMYGPKGMGALFVSRKPRIRLEAQTHGGGHERGMRSGTLATHQIAGFGMAAKIALEEMNIESKSTKALRDKLYNGLKDIPAIKVNGNLEHSIPGLLNISFNYVEGESLMMALKGMAVSSGSACTSASLEPSYVLRALGLSDELAHSSIRFSIGRFTTEEEIDYVIKEVTKGVNKLRDLSPLWEMHCDGIDLSSVEWVSH